MRVVGCGSPEVVVRHRARQVVLRPAAAAVVADDDVELPVGAERQDPAVVISPQHRQRRVGHVVAVVLERAQPDDVLVEDQDAAVPPETVHAVAKQRDVREDVRVGAGCAFGVVQIHVRRAREARVQRDAQQAPFAVGVHGQVEHDACHEAVGHTLDLPGRLLGDEDVVGPDERHRDRLRQAAHDGRYTQARIEQGLLCASVDRVQGKPDARDDARRHGPPGYRQKLKRHWLPPLMYGHSARGAARPGGGPIPPVHRLSEPALRRHLENVDRLCRKASDVPREIPAKDHACVDESCGGSAAGLTATERDYGRRKAVGGRAAPGHARGASAGID